MPLNTSENTSYLKKCSDMKHFGNIYFKTRKYEEMSQSKKTDKKKVSCLSTEFW